MESLETIIDFWVEEDPRAEACRDFREAGMMRSLTYSQLRDEYVGLAYNIGCLINKSDIEPRSRRPVGVCMTRGSYWYSTFFALVALGIPLVPMTQDIADESTMEIRNRMILSSLRPIFVISDSTTPSSIQHACAEFEIPLYDITLFLTPSTSPSPPPKRLRDISSVPLAYLYTGGTTSGCKCVQVSHGMAMHEIKSYPPLIPKQATREVVLQHSSTYWGATFLGQINIALAIGGCVVFSDNSTDLTSIIESQNITIIGVVPSQLRALLGSCPTLRTIFTWGEKLPQAVAKKRISKTTQVVELLVSTEYWLSLYAINGANEFSIIDSPNVDIRISSNGELLIGGACVTPFGYTDESLNLTSFTTMDEKRYYATKDLMTEVNGKLRFAGRADHLIKIGGEWKDLHCVESQLRKIEGVDDVAVLPQTTAGKPAVFVVIAGPMKHFGQIRKIVNQAYIRLVFVSKLPRNQVTGKVDRQALIDHIEPKTDFGSNAKSRRINTCVIWCILTLTSAGYLVFLHSIFALILFPYIVLFFLCIPRKKLTTISSILNWPSNLIGNLFWSAIALTMIPIHVSACIGLVGLWMRRDIWWPVVFWFGIARQIERWIQSLSQTRRDRRMVGGGENKVGDNRVNRSWSELASSDFKKFSKIEIFDYELDEIFDTLREKFYEDETCGQEMMPNVERVTSPIFESLVNIIENVCDMLPLPISTSTQLSGLSSLVAVMLSNSIRDTLGRKIAVSDVLKCELVGDLVACVDSAELISSQPSAKKSSENKPISSPSPKSYRCQMWGWGLACMWIFEAPPGSTIHYKSLREALSIMADRHSAFRAMPIDPNPLWYWMNDVFVTFGLIKWMSPVWLSTILNFFGSKIFSASCRITTREKKKFYLGWNETVFRSRSELRAYLNKGFHPPITAEILTLDEPSADSKRHLLRLYLTHAFSDGSSVVPILAELNMLYEAIMKGEKEVSVRPLPADGLRIQESRLHAALTNTVANENDLYLFYNMDASAEPADGFGETIIMEECFVSICHAACAKMGCSIDVLFLSGIVCALARLDTEKSARTIPLSLIVPLRDSPGDASEAVGFLADLRNIDVLIGSRSLSSLLSVVQSIIEIRRDRRWIIPEPYSSCERALINIVPAANVQGDNFFSQELCLQQTPGRTFVAQMTRPMELYVEQISRMQWTFRARCRYNEWSEEKFAEFVSLFKESIIGILVDPNQLL